jgi:hypothetical protein
MHLDSEAEGGRITGNTQIRRDAPKILIGLKDKKV